MPEGDLSQITPSKAIAKVTVRANMDGSFGPVQLFTVSNTNLGNYDLWVDLNKNGIYDDGDMVREEAVGTASIIAIPEFSEALLVMVVPLILLVVFTNYAKQRNPSTCARSHAKKYSRRT
ncbi:MAG: hypothetical protein QXQ11_06770 [Candidatus Bathyarchaeia archaeon]